MEDVDLSSLLSTLHAVGRSVNSVTLNRTASAIGKGMGASAGLAVVAHSSEYNTVNGACGAAHSVFSLG
jgi:predicted RNA polymerase sigma factor